MTPLLFLGDGIVCRYIQHAQDALQNILNS